LVEEPHRGTPELAVIARALIAVEGQTEETFVRDILAPHLETFRVYAQSVVITTKRPASGGKFRGGVSAWAAIRREITQLLRDTSAAAVTTMIDLYGLPQDCPGIDVSRLSAAHHKVALVEAAIAGEINNARFRPYIQLHEFETLMFAAPDVCGSRSDNPAVATTMARAVHSAGEPELVNDGPNTAPSKRILALWPGYLKTVDGPAIVKSVGLQHLRQECPHFGEWLNWLESLRSV
jgi:Domain of unknown function (DUF4276)